MRIRMTAAVLVMLSLGGCARYVATEHPGPLYTVTTSVMQNPPDVPRACSGIPLPYPPIGCGGVALEGIDLPSSPGVSRYRNGVLATGMLHLVGTWNGRALNLTQRPESAATNGATPMPICADTPGRSSAEPIPPGMQRIIADDKLLRTRGIQLLEFGPCRDFVFAVVPVADASTVAFLTGRYGSGNVVVAGWLQPVS
jgi:hypothetical protein